MVLQPPSPGSNVSTRYQHATRAARLVSARFSFGKCRDFGVRSGGALGVLDSCRCGWFHRHGTSHTSPHGRSTSRTDEDFVHVQPGCHVPRRKEQRSMPSSRTLDPPPDRAAGRLGVRHGRRRRWRRTCPPNASTGWAAWASRASPPAPPLRTGTSTGAGRLVVGASGVQSK